MIYHKTARLLKFIAFAINYIAFYFLGRPLMEKMHPAAYFPLFFAIIFYCFMQGYIAEKTYLMWKGEKR